ERIGRRSHAGDEGCHTVILGGEGVPAQHGAPGVVVQFQVYPVHGVVPTAGRGRLHELASEFGPGGLGRFVDRGGDLLLGHHGGGQAPLLEPGEQADGAGDVVVGQVQAPYTRIGQGQVVAAGVAVHQPFLDRPVQVSFDQAEVPGFQGGQSAGPQLEHLLIVVGGLTAGHELPGPVQVELLQVDGGALAAVGHGDRGATADVVGDLPQRTHRVLHGQVGEDTA